MSRTHFPIRLSELKLGGVERNGEHVSLTYENEAFIIRRSPHHPAGHAIRSARTLRRARLLASTLRNEKGPTA